MSCCFKPALNSKGLRPVCINYDVVVSFKPALNSKGLRLENLSKTVVLDYASSQP